METQNLDSQINHAARLIVQAKKLVVFTGAGISTESGIPDFRGPDGIWNRYDPEDFTYQRFVADPETRCKVWHMFTHNWHLLDAQPNPAHHAIAELERLDRLDCVITQNIDNLHQKAGNSPKKVLELHGNLQQAVCLNCHQLYPLKDILSQLNRHSEPPDCPKCNGIVKPDAIFFGEPLPERTFHEAVRRARQCDLLMVIGSTLVVHPAALIPMYAKNAGAKLIIINLSTTPLDQEASVLIRGKAGEVMSKVMEELKRKIPPGRKENA